jgi:hypothetical protein
VSRHVDGIGELVKVYQADPVGAACRARDALKVGVKRDVGPEALGDAN